MKKILIVEDSPTEVFQLKKMLEKYAYNVVVAENGREGVEVARNDKPDLILMDVIMPEVNGYQATRQLHSDESLNHIPVIIVSTKDQDTDRVWGMRQGASAYLTKPVSEEELINTIKDFLN